MKDENIEVLDTNQKDQPSFDNKILNGLGCRIRFPGAVIIDTRPRRAKPKFVGLVRPCFTRHGFVLCPIAKSRLIFDTPDIPRRFRSPQKAWIWVKKHAIGWTDNKLSTDVYILSKTVFGSKRLYWFIRDYRIQFIMMQIIFSIVFYTYEVTDQSMISQVSLKIASGLFGLGAFVNSLIVLKDHFWN